MLSCRGEGKNLGAPGWLWVGRFPVLLRWEQKGLRWCLGKRTGQVASGGRHGDGDCQKKSSTRGMRRAINDWGAGKLQLVIR